MVIATPAAIAKLSALITEHPEDPVVRLTIVHRDDERRGGGVKSLCARRSLGKGEAM
jgi:hypothetical protein